MNKAKAITEQRAHIAETRARLAGRTDELQDSVLGFVESGDTPLERFGPTAIRVGAVAAVVLGLGFVAKTKTSKKVAKKRDRARGREYAKALMKVAPEIFGPAAAAATTAAEAPAESKKSGSKAPRMLMGALVLAAGAFAGQALVKSRQN